MNVITNENVPSRLHVKIIEKIKGWIYLFSTENTNRQIERANEAKKAEVEGELSLMKLAVKSLEWRRDFIDGQDRREEANLKQLREEAANRRESNLG